MKVVGTYGPHLFRGRNGLAKPKNIDYTKLSRINYGPFQTNKHGSIWGTDANLDPQILFGPRNWNPPTDSPKHCYLSSPDAGSLMQCHHHFYEKGLVSRAHANDVEVYFVIGGPEWSEKFSVMAANPGSRATFARNVVLTMINYDFDGLDMAWQFPKSLEDMTNYVILLTDIRRELKKEGQFGITATLPCSHDEMTHIDIRLLSSVLTEFNLLAYDFHGPWGGNVGANSPLYDRGADSVSGCVLKYVEDGASKDQINIGLSFSGHSYRGGKNMGDTCKANWDGLCSDTETWQEDGGSPQYYNIYKKMPDMALSFDLQTMTPMASNDKGVVSFDDPRSICLKADFAALHKLNGFIINDLAGDILDDGSTPLLDALNMKIAEQDIECGGEEFENLFEWRKVGRLNTWNNAAAKSTNNELSAVVPKSGPTYRYTCGIGEGDAKDRCSSYEWEDISCETGTCPSDMICFIVLCTKPKGGEVEEQEQPAKVAFSETKTKPRKKPVRRDRHWIQSEIPLAQHNAEEFMVREDTFGTDSAPKKSADVMTFSCGANVQSAQSCSKLCPNGITDCPSGQFCFWLPCDASNSVPAEPIVSLVRPTVPPTTKYQCGETRAIAQTCSEECGFAWQCPDGKDCYHVPCPA